MLNATLFQEQVHAWTAARAKSCDTAEHVGSACRHRGEKSHLCPPKGHLWEQDFIVTQKMVQRAKMPFKCQMPCLIFFQRELSFAGSRHDQQKVIKWSYSQTPTPTSTPTATSKETIVQTHSVCSSTWVTVMLLVLLYRWAGGGAEKDIHKMDQFPFGKGKSLFPLLLPVLFCLWAQTLAPLLRIENPSHCLFHFNLHCSSMLYVMLFSTTHRWAGHGTVCAGSDLTHRFPHMPLFLIIRPISNSS